MFTKKRLRNVQEKICMINLGILPYPLLVLSMERGCLCSLAWILHLLYFQGYSCLKMSLPVAPLHLKNILSLVPQIPFAKVDPIHCVSSNLYPGQFIVDQILQYNFFFACGGLHVQPTRHIQQPEVQGLLDLFLSKHHACGRSWRQ